MIICSIVEMCLNIKSDVVGGALTAYKSRNQGLGLSLPLSCPVALKSEIS